MDEEESLSQEDKNSILISIKKLLGIPKGYSVFDQDIIMHINSVFMILNQLGIGPEKGYYIDDAADAWSEFVDNDADLNAIKSYMYLKVRLLFDPPINGTVMEAMKQQISELEWRLNVKKES